MGKQSTFVSTVQKGKKPEGLGVQGQREPGGGRQRAGRECFGPSCAPAVSGVGDLQNLGAADGERKSGGFVNVLLPGQMTKMGDHLPPQALATVALAVDGLVHNLSAIPANL